MTTGQTSTFTFGTTGLTLGIISIDPPEESVEDIETPTLDQSVGDYKLFDPSDLIEGGEFTLELENDMNSDIPLREKETLTWTKPLQSGDSTPASWSFPGYIKKVKENSFETSERATITVAVKVAGEITKTAAA